MSTAATNPPGLTPPVIPAEGSRKSASPWTQKKADARRLRKAEGRSQRERDACDLAQQLMFLADRPEFAAWRGDLNALIAHVRKSGKRTPDRDVEAITKALAMPYNREGATAKDVVEDTHIPAAEVKTILENMCSLGTAEKFQKEVPEIARGAAIWLYRLTGRPPRTPDVLP